MHIDPDSPGPGSIVRIAFIGIGWLCVGLGSLGIIMPVLPTTPFLLIAVWAFSRASPELAARIRTHPRCGPYIVDWEKNGVIPPFAKLLACLMMAGAYAWLHFATEAPLPVKALVGLILLTVTFYIVTRPGRAGGG